ncbi:hypothetical protein FGO68_gene751 [Halteria grandinella]|uniref:Uncharacterized protein n=1 Tax=Halteria grandinella TaxID=5974 RepID=A0A8J8P472_HALGN|nr:hypothetical protein FGO68_gene751 [Halteria grandinella]
MPLLIGQQPQLGNISKNQGKQKSIQNKPNSTQLLTQQDKYIINYINQIIIGVAIYDTQLCDRYRSICHLTQEGQFVNLNFNDQEEQISRMFKENGGEDKRYDVPSYERTFNRVEAAMQLFDSKREPYITQHIDFS